MEVVGGELDAHAAAAGEAGRAGAVDGQPADALRARGSIGADDAARAAVVKVAREVDAGAAAHRQRWARALDAATEKAAPARRAGDAAPAAVVGVGVEVDARAVAERELGAARVGDGEIRRARVAGERDPILVAARRDGEKEERDPMCKCANG